MTEYIPNYPIKRDIIIITGLDAESFLQKIVTADISSLPPFIAQPCALLNPQGKIMFSFLISRCEEQFLINIVSNYTENFIKRLSLYRLHNKVTISKAADSQIIVTNNPASTDFYQDIRFKNFQLYYKYNLNNQAEIIESEEKEQLDSLDFWGNLWAENGILEFGLHYKEQEFFPHDLNFDCLKAVSFTKGCYIGQEVVARMQHKTTPKRRVLLATASQPLPQGTTAIMADNKQIGTLYCTNVTKANALIRIDKAANAIDNNIAILADNVDITLQLPNNSCFKFQ